MRNILARVETFPAARARKPERGSLGWPAMVLVPLVIGGLFPAFSNAGSPQLVSGMVAGRPVDGLELVRGTHRRLVLDRNGWLHDFDPQQIEHALRTRDGQFEPLEAMQLRARLAGEFGRDFEVVATEHFLVVAPVGRGAYWPQTFERLHRTFTTFFSLRGVQVRTGSFPMVAIVMPDKASMHGYLDTLGIRSPDALGVYDRASNRIVMYDHGVRYGGVATTICHEAAHQSAFNTGVHSRVADTPQWIVEGVGCLFQSAALVEGRSGTTRRDRCDAGQLIAFEEIYGDRPEWLMRDLESLVRGGQMFRDRESTRSAYALSWALTFYLVELHGERFAELITLYGKLPPLQTYSELSRINDFERVLGDDIATVAHQLSRFYNRL